MARRRHACIVFAFWRGNSYDALGVACTFSVGLVGVGWWWCCGWMDGWGLFWPRGFVLIPLALLDIVLGVLDGGCLPAPFLLRAARRGGSWGGGLFFLIATSLACPLFSFFLRWLARADKNSLILEWLFLVRFSTLFFLLSFPFVRLGFGLGAGRECGPWWAVFFSPLWVGGIP